MRTTRTISRIRGPLPEIIRSVNIVEKVNKEDVLNVPLAITVALITVSLIFLIDQFFKNL
jgi:hypothetical protein